MEIEVIEQNDEVLKAKLKESNEAVANSLRRTMVSKVPTLSPKQLEITVNNSGMFDEVIANRVGQIPFTIPGNFSNEDELHLAVKKEGPGNVKAEDIQTDNEDATPVNPEAIIVKLKEEQALEFEGTAVLGKGKEHAKHQGGTVGYEKTGENEFLFRIESTSGYSNEELLETAINQIKEELEEFKNIIEEF